MRDLMERMATMHPTTLYNPDRYALQVVVEATNPSDALLNALTAWRAAAVDTCLEGQQLARAEVISSREFERERELLEQSPRRRQNGRVDDLDEADALLRRAFHDTVTGLANVELFLTHLQHVLRRAGRTGQAHALLLCGLDSTSPVDRAGTEGTSDLVLVAVAERIASTVRPSDCLARVGREEFAVLLNGMTASDALGVAHRLVRAISTPIDTPGGHVRITASVGITAAAGVDARHVLQEAQGALAAAGALGNNRCEVFARPDRGGDGADHIRRPPVRHGKASDRDVPVREGGS
ncbi:MAG TPA: GGDEF domain-containing protein [Egibacteraceae bacterium]|nr:GGDEF domain-containing protein [Egibacteraceae bacterium]